jgi:hypothetical protein
VTRPKVCCDNIGALKQARNRLVLFIFIQVFRDHTASIRDSTHRSDSSSPSEDEDEDDDSGADDGICHTRGSGGWEALRGLRKVKDEADNAFLSDRLAT